MKLVELLSKKFNVWPKYQHGIKTGEDVEGITQNSHGHLNEIDAGCYDSACFREEYNDWDFPSCRFLQECSPKGGVLSEVAEDFSTAKVTKEQWEAERKRMNNTSLRQSIPEDATHFDNAPHVSIYRWHKLKNELWYFFNENTKEWIMYGEYPDTTYMVPILLEGTVTEKVKEDPSAIKDRILAIRKELLSLEKEEESLTQRLNQLGLALYEKLPAEQWKQGDVVRCLEGASSLTVGKEYVVIDMSYIVDKLYVVVHDDCGDQVEFYPRRFEWVHRQQKENNRW